MKTDTSSDQQTEPGGIPYPESGYSPALQRTLKEKFDRHIDQPCLHLQRLDLAAVGGHLGGEV